MVRTIHGVVAPGGGRWFRASDVLGSLGYCRPGWALQSLAPRERRPLCEVLPASAPDATEYLSEAAVRQLASRPRAAALRAWLEEEQSRRQPEVPAGRATSCGYALRNETELHARVVQFLRRFFP